MCTVEIEEKSLSFIKDVKSTMDVGGNLCVLSLSPESVELEQRTDPLSQVVSKYFQEQLEINSKTSLLDIWAYFGNMRTEFTLALGKDFLTDMGSLLPQPFLRIKGTLEDAGEGFEREIEFEKELKFNDISLKTGNLGGVTTPREKFVVPNPHPRPDQVQLICHMDVHLGWQVSKEVAQIGAHSLLEKMLEDEGTKDLTMIAGNGAEIKCHQNVFAAHTPTLSAVLSAKTGMRESRLKKVELRENSEEGLRHLINYLYGLKLVLNEMSSDLAVELFQTAHKYGLGQLEESLLQVMLKKDVKWFTPDVLLELYFFVRNLEAEAMEKLKEHSLHLLATMDTEELRSCAEFKKLSLLEVTDLSFKIIKFTQKFTPRMTVTAPNYEISSPGSSGGVKRKKTY